MKLNSHLKFSDCPTKSLNKRPIREAADGAGSSTSAPIPRSSFAYGTFYSSVVKHSQEIVFLLHFNITGPHRHTDLK
jgi:hypothetical protein